MTPFSNNARIDDDGDHVRRREYFCGDGFSD
jgi:hypothetical protein